MRGSTSSTPDSTSSKLRSPGPSNKPRPIPHPDRRPTESTDMANISNRRPKPSQGKEEHSGLPARPYADALLSVIAESRLNAAALARESGVDQQTIRRFMRRDGDMMLASADKLAVALGVKVVRWV